MLPAYNNSRMRRLFLAAAAASSLTGLYFSQNIVSSCGITTLWANDKAASSPPTTMSGPCTDVPVLVVILTMDRPLSLQRLLTSLIEAEYGCAPIDLSIAVDTTIRESSHHDDDDDIRLDNKKLAAARVRQLALDTPWPHGTKTVHRRLQNAGLRNSWLEGAYQHHHNNRGREETPYVALFEDDLEVSSQWYQWVNRMASQPGFFADDDRVASLCLHPSGNPRDMYCDDAHPTESQVLWTTQFVCSWGPVWKFPHWRALVEHAAALRERREKPYLPKNARDARDFHSWIDRGFDVQSVYAKRYLLEQQVSTLLYSATACFPERTANNTFLALNHKEVGLHYAKKQAHQTQEHLLVRELSTLEGQLTLGRRENEMWGRPQHRHEPQAYDWDAIRRKHHLASLCGSTDHNAAYNLTYRLPEGKNHVWKPPQSARAPRKARPVPPLPCDKKKANQCFYESNDKRAVASYLNRTKGVFLEMGGLDGLFQSNSLYVESLGWQGILIEADPDSFSKLLKNRPNVLAIQAAVCEGNAGGVVHFVKSKQAAVNGIWEFMGDAYKQTWYPDLVGRDDLITSEKGTDNAVITKVACVPLSELFRRMCVKHIDYFSLDVEGAEPAVLRSIDWSAVTVNVISVETYRAGRLDEEELSAIKELLLPQGFDFEGVVHRDAWFVHQRLKAGAEA